MNIRLIKQNACGNTGYIHINTTVPKELVGKKVRIKLELVK